MLHVSTKIVKIHLDIFLNMYVSSKHSKVCLYPTSKLSPLVRRITENEKVTLFLGFILQFLLMEPKIHTVLQPVTQRSSLALYSSSSPALNQ